MTKELPESAAFEAYWARVLETKWLDSVPANRHSRLRADMLALFRENPTRAYEALSTGGFDGECINDDGSYSQVIRWYAEASGGVFAPTNVKDRLDWDKCKAFIQFTYRGRTFKKTLPFEGDYLPPEFDAFINDVLRQCKIRQRFVQLPTRDQMAWIAFVDPRAYKKAISNFVLPDQRDLEEEMSC